MKYTHPTIKIETPAPGHYVIKGHAPRSVFIEGEGTLVPPHECYISPEVPSEALQAILDEREAADAGEASGGETEHKAKRGRKSKAPATAAPEANEEDFK